MIYPGSNVQNLDEFDQRIMFISFAFFFTTGYVQDFKDVAGDAAVGRNTVPMVFPTAGRVVYAFFVVLWSVLYSKMWEMEVTYAALFIAYALFMGFFALSFRTVKCDLLTYQLYCVSKYLTHCRDQGFHMHDDYIRLILCSSSSFRHTIATSTRDMSGCEVIDVLPVNPPRP